MGTGVDGAEPAPGTSHGLSVSPDAAGVEAATLSPVAAARSHGFGGGAAIERWRNRGEWAEGRSAGGARTRGARGSARGRERAGELMFVSNSHEGKKRTC